MVQSWQYKEVCPEEGKQETDQKWNIKMDVKFPFSESDLTSTAGTFSIPSAWNIDLYLYTLKTATNFCLVSCDFYQEHFLLSIRFVSIICFKSGHKGRK